MNKFNATQTGSFPSQLEAKVYIELCRLFGAKNVQCQFLFKLTASIGWRIDFKVTGEPYDFLVEAKGFPTETFGLKLNLLKDLHPAYASRLVIIGTDYSMIKSLSKKHPKTLHLKEIDRIIEFFPAIATYMRLSK